MPTTPKSPLGFLALDLDGMTLVEKIDKNPWYGWNNPQSHVRQAIIEYVKAAQEMGYDIIILTARPAAVELALENLNIGTKPTATIVETLQAYGINIKPENIVRAPAGLKGGKMQELIKAYHQAGCHDAVGMLFDDQLKQVRDVQKQGNMHLRAYDINSEEDIKDFLSKVGQGLNKEHPFHPDQIIAQVSAQNINVLDLKNKIDGIDDNKYPAEKKAMEQLLNNLCIRLYEAAYRKYQPELDWVASVIIHMESFVDKLNTNQQITTTDIDVASKEILGTADLDQVLPNTESEQLVKDALIEFRKIPIISRLNDECSNYADYLEASTESDKETVERHLAIVNQLKPALENPNPTEALQRFAHVLKENKVQLKQSPEGQGFFEGLRVLMTKIPVIGHFFKTENEKLSHKAEKIIANYKQRIESLKEKDKPEAGQSASMNNSL